MTRLYGIYKSGYKYVPTNTDYVEYVEIVKENVDGSFNMQAYDYRGKKYGRSFKMTRFDIDRLRPFEEE